MTTAQLATAAPATPGAAPVDATAAAPVAGTDIVKQDGTKWGSGTANTGFDPYTPASTGWNGGIYVDVTSASTTTPLNVRSGPTATSSSIGQLQPA